MIKRWDVVIVGGGLAGLVAANYLAKSGMSICILEKGKHVGGRAKTDRLRQQYFNLGPHALYKKGKAKQYLEELGIEFYGKSPKLDVRLMDNNREYSAPFNALSFVSSDFLNWKEQFEWFRALLKIIRLNPDQYAQHTFEQWVCQTSHSTNVQSLLYLLGRLTSYCHAPDQVSAKVVLTHLKSAALGGVLYIDGGWQTIVDQLHNKAVMNGVDIQTHHTVKLIEQTEQESFQLTLSNDEQMISKYVLYTADPKALNLLLDGKINLSHLNQTKPIKGAAFDVALTKLPNPKKLYAMGLNAPLYFAVHSIYARLSEDRKSVVLHVFKYYQPDEEIDGATVQKELEQFLEKMQPGWQNYLITSRFIPQITVNHRLPQIGDEQKLLNATSMIPRLFIAGDWAHPDFILSEGAVSSGKLAAEEIMKEMSDSYAN